MESETHLRAHHLFRDRHSVLWNHGRLADARKRRLGLHHGWLHEVLGPYGAKGWELVELRRLLFRGLVWD